MSKVTVTESYLEGIGDAIRNKLNTSQGYTPGQMAAAIESIPTGGITPTGTKNITQNGQTDVTQYATADVNVPNSYAAGDEGKVVQNGALVAQTSETVTQNGTYDTTTKDEVVVNVQGGGTPTLQDKTVTQNGTYTADAGYDGLGTVTVNVSGGGGGNIEEWDLTSSYIGTEHGMPMLYYNVNQTSAGVVFRAANSRLRAPIGCNGITVEVDVAAMNLSSGTHRRFLMASDSEGFIYRSTGVWAFYNGTWYESGETDGAFFSGSTVKVNIDSEGYWHVYKDGVLWWEPTGKLNIRELFWIGSDANSINNATISGVRIS